MLSSPPMGGGGKALPEETLTRGMTPSSRRADLDGGKYLLQSPLRKEEASGTGPLERVPSLPGVLDRENSLIGEKWYALAYHLSKKKREKEKERGKGGGEN